MQFGTSGQLHLELYQWESAIQRFKRRCLGRDGSTKWKNKAGRSGKSLSIGCSLVRYASPRHKLKSLNDCKPDKDRLTTRFAPRHRSPKVDVSGDREVGCPKNGFLPDVSSIPQ